MRCPSRQLTCARYFARLPRKIRLLACHQVSAKGRTRSACRRSTRSFLAIDAHRLVLVRVSPTPPSAVLPLLEYFSILRFRADTTVIRSHSSTCRVASRALFLVYLCFVYECWEITDGRGEAVNHHARDNVWVQPFQRLDFLIYAIPVHGIWKLIVRDVSAAN